MNSQTSTIGERLAELAISETGFVFDPRSGQSFSANSTGVEALKLFRAGNDARTTAARLAEMFAQDEAFTRPAVDAFARMLERHFP